MEHDTNEETTVREQHFFREGNAEVLRLVTRGQVEDNATTSHQPHPHRPPTLIIDGKDIILQRFIEDQKSRHELSMQDIEAARSMESHQRSKDVCNQQPEIILIPERLELGHRQHVEEIGPNVQRLVIDHDRDYDSRKGKESRTMRETVRQERQEAGSIAERPTLIVAKDQSNNTQYPFHDLELARQNVLLTRLLLEKENRRAGAMDSTSYLETQSLPGQVAIATQTDRTAATQTDRHVKSRSDNDESDNEESRYRKRLRSRKKYGGDGDWRRSRTLWMKSPIEEEGSPCFDKRLSILRKKVREVKEGRKISLEPEVLREISDSLDGNGSSCKGEEDETMRSYRKSTEQTSISYKILNEKESGSSEERRKEKREEKSSEEVTDDRRMNNATESSSPEIKVQREKHVGPKEKSPKRETRSKAQKSEGVIKPSFRILEKEFTMLTKKLSKLGDKKFQESTASDSTCQEKSDSLAKETKKDLDQKSLKKMDLSTSQKHETTSKPEQKGKQRKDSAIAKTKQKLKYQQSQVMSTGSSELDDSLGFDKPKKPSGTRHESTKQKQSVGKVKRLVQQMDRRESKKQVSESKDEETEKRKDGVSKGTPKGELKSEKIGKVATKAPKLTVISRKQNVIEETSTSTEEKREEERGAFAFEKKSSTDFSERDSNGLFQLERERVEKKIIQKFSDDFVEREDTSEQKVTTSTEEEKDTASTEERKVGMVESSKNGIRKSQDLFEKSTKEQEERVTSSRKALDDHSAHLHTKEQLITDIKFIDMGPTKKEELGKIVVRDQKIDKMTSKVEPTKIQKPMKREDESIKYSEEDKIKETKRELVSKSEKEIIERVRDKLEDYMEKDKPSNGFKKQIEPKLDTRIEESKQEEDRELSDTYKYLKEEIEKMSEDFKKKRDESKRTELEEKEENVLSRYAYDIEDKNGAKQKAEKRIQVEVHVPTEKEHNGKMDTTQKMEKDIKSQVLSNGEDSMKFDITDVHIADKLEEEKEKVKLVDVSTTDHIFEKEDSTKIPFNGDDKEKISLSMEIPHKQETTSIIETDKQVEENIFLDDREIDDKGKEDIKIKPDNRIVESIITSSEDKKISDEQKFIVKSIEEDYGISMEDYKITEETIKDEKFDAETIVDYEVTEETAKDQKIDKEETKDRKFEGETSMDHKITEEKTEDSKIDEKQITSDRALTMEKIKDQQEDFKIVGEASMDQKIIGERTKDETIDKESIEKHKIPEEAIVKIIEEIPKDQKIKDDTMKDDSITEKATVSLIEETSKDQVVKEILEDYEIVEKAIEDFKITKEVTIDHKMEEKVKEDYTIVGERFDDDKSLIKTDFTTKEEISDKKQDSTEIDDNKISREESIFLDKKKDPDEKTFAKKIDIDDHEISTKEEIDSQKKRSISPEIKEIFPVVEVVTELIKSDDEKISDKEDIFIGKEKEIPIKEKKEIPESDKIEKESITDDKDKEEDSNKKKKVITENTEETDGRPFEETIKEMQIIDDHKIIEKEILETKEIIDDHQISDKEIVPATLEIEETPAEKQDDIQERHIEKEDVPLRISQVDKDDEMKEKEDSSKISMEVPIVPSIDDNIKQETSTDTESTEYHASKKDNVFSEMFKAVHSLVDKLTNGKRSRKTSVEEVAITEFHSDDKIIHKEVALLPPDDDKEKYQESSISSEPSASRVNSDSIKLMEEQIDDKKITSKDFTDDKVAISPEETTGKSMQIDIVSESKRTESDENSGIDKFPKGETIKLILEKPLLEKVEIDEPLKHDPASLIQLADEKIKDVSETLSEKTTEMSEESKEAIPDNERMDFKPVRIGEEELSLAPTSSKASTSFQEIESLRSCSQTCETTTQEKEKLVPDSIISETSTDSAKALEFEKQLKSAESKQIELQEMEQFVEEESFIVGGGIQKEGASFPEGQSRESTESDVRTIVYRDESDKREDRTKGEMDKTLKKRTEEEGIPVEEEYVSLPLFTSVIDTMDDSEDSDSSSDISRKTTLTTRPYQTPRNRARQVSERESSQTEQVTGTESIGDEEQAILAVEVIGNGNVDSPKEERMLEKVEDAGMEQAPLTGSTDAVKGEETGSREEFINVQPCFSGERLRTTSDTEVDKESWTRHTKDTKSETKRGKDGKINREDEPSSASKLAKTDTFKVADKKAKEQERKKIPPRRKKKSCSEESPGREGKTTRSQDATSECRARGKPLEDRSRQKDSEKAKQERRREEESEKQKQFASRLKIEKDKKSSSSVSEKYPTPSRSGEIDTSRTQPKYMAWYKKNREEMEKRRAELMATDDEEQLPRWLRRSMRGQRVEKEDKKQRQSRQKTADTTPRTRRKVKPLVNVESEQLKAIVRQGRKLRRAEGGRNEDPPVQIFATTPPHDPKHHLMQHSEYKYEKAPAPFYLHPPPPPHPSPQLSPEHFEIPPTMECGRTDEEFDSGIAVSLQAGSRRHQQLLEKKSVFDIAYSEAAPSQLRSDSTTPPS